jgi:hypothetical protein
VNNVLNVDFCKCGKTLPIPVGVLATIQENILANSWVKQENFAFSAALVLLGTLISRKFVYGGLSSNLYILNVAPSGSGKDAPQQLIKKYLLDINKAHLLGAGDYVSDASLMDGLESKPVRLDIMDEAGGILKSVTSGEAQYNGKMADILAELYTSSNSRYLGRATADGTKGSCYRPNVSILASTTPTGLSEGISLKAIEKGLMGRFLLFLGDYDQKAKRIRDFPSLDATTKVVLKYWAEYQPKENKDVVITGMEQLVETMLATKQAEDLLDSVFEEFDNIRTTTDGDSPMMPIIARLYQQMVKITMIHAVSRAGVSTPVIDCVDVEFGRSTILYYFETIKKVVNKYVFGNSNERDIVRVLEIIEKHGTISTSNLNKKTRTLGKKRRDDVIKELIDSEQIVADVENLDGKSTRVYRRV